LILNSFQNKQYSKSKKYQLSAKKLSTDYQMPFTKTSIPGLLEFVPAVFEDSRGYFFESYNENIFLAEGITIKFVQDNQAKSSYGVIRGLHFQKAPYAQTKLIRVLSGAILDVAVDVRIGSPTYGHVYALELSAANKKQLLVPKGFAHGYSVLSETAEVLYKCDAFYNKQSEGGLLFNDRELNIDWKIPADKAIVADKDLLHPGIDNCTNNFIFGEQ
jgi:dTDP-4-dehydrorhamnose 3,5-epimerase